MKNVKCLITAGCSYTQVPNTDVTWPVPLNECLKPETVLFLGQGAAGNGIISSKAIYNTVEQLKKYQPHEILVGIMWSGFDRGTVYSTKELNCTRIDHGDAHLVYANPVKVIDGKNYYITNMHWNDPLSTQAKENFDKESSLLSTLEHILRTQWFLQSHNVPYFMTEYDYDVFDKYPFDRKTIKNNPDLKFLWDQIDWSKWLPIENCFSWAKYDSGFNFARPDDGHPSTEQHKALVERIIIPFLLDKKMVYDTIV